MILDLTDAQRSFRESIEQFARETVAPQAGRIDASGEFPLDLLRAAARVGLVGVTVPPAWGGAGRDYVSYALAIETVARASATVAASLVVTNSLVADVIAHAGSDRQKDQWLRPLAAGEAVGAFALSEPDAGTDAANQQTNAVENAGGYRITGRKVWVANAEAARVAIVFAATTASTGSASTTGSPVARKSRPRGVTAFLVPMDTPGIRRRARDESLGVRGLGCMDLEFDIEV